jgi:hypothetical protein
MHPNHFAKLLVIVLPATLILTYLMKVTSMDHMRRDAIAELYASTDETAAALPKEIHVYHSGGGGNAFSSSSCSDAERRALVRIGGRLGGPHDNFMLRSGWGEAADCCDWRGVGCARGTGVEVLSLSKESLHGTLPTELGALPNLVSIDLNENSELSGTLPSELGLATRLKQFYGFGLRVSGTLPTSLSTSKTLQELELSFCRLSGTLPTNLPASLRFVFLESNKISGAIPASVGALRRLRELELSHNKFSGSLPARVAHLRLDHLDVGQNPRLTGVPKQKPQQGCSGGGDKYLRGGLPEKANATI